MVTEDAHLSLTNATPARIGGTAGIIVAVVGLLPIAAGAGNFCLAGPLLGTDLQGRPRGERG